VMVIGTDGGLRLDLPPPYEGRPGEVRVERWEPGERSPVARVLRAPPGTGFLRELEAFHRAVTGGPAAEAASAAAAARDTRCLQRLLAALAEGHGLRAGGEAAEGG
jgi:hypothetical protein